MRVLLLSTLLVAVVLVSSTLAASSLSVRNSVAITRSGLAGTWFDYIVVIVMENHGINATYGSSCMGDCLYFNNLANAYSLAKNYDKGGVPGSLGDYIALTSGVETVTCNGPPPDCVPDVANIVDRIEGVHLSWRAYMEDYPTNCAPSCSPGGCFVGSSFGGVGHYSSTHNPFVYYRDIVNSTGRCRLITPANSLIDSTQACGTPTPIVETDDLFLKDLNSVVNASNYMFLTPNNFDNVHDCGGPVSIGNAYLQRMIPRILNSTLFQTRRAAVFVTFDEPDPYRGTPPNDSSKLYTVWASYNSAHTKPTYQSIKPYNHFSSLKTVENNWGFPPFFTSKNDGPVPDMGEFLLT